MGGVLSVIALALRNSSPRVKQSGYWLMSCGAVHCAEQLVPLAPELIPLCVAGLGPTVTMTVSMNANRAIGEMCMHGPPEILAPHLSAIAPALVAILQRGNIKPFQMQGHHELLRNTCYTLNILRQKSALGQQWPAICAQLPPDVLMKLQQRYGLSA